MTTKEHSNAKPGLHRKAPSNGALKTMLKAGALEALARTGAFIAGTPAPVDCRQSEIEQPAYCPEIAAIGEELAKLERSERWHHWRARVTKNGAWVLALFTLMAIGLQVGGERSMRSAEQSETVTVAPAGSPHRPGERNRP